MIKLLVLVTSAYTVIILTWVYYLAMMVLKRHHKNLSGGSKFLGYQALAVGLALDVLLNIFVATIIFLDPPREWLFTNRLKRCKHRTDFRGKLARLFCEKMLDPFDPSGTHC